MTMVLTVAVPSLVAVEMRSRHRSRVVTTVDDVAFITSVRVVRRIRIGNEALDPDRAEVEAFIPEHQRLGIEARRNDWISPEYLRCYARLSLNQKSLREFFDSGEHEWRIE